MTKKTKLQKDWREERMAEIRSLIKEANPKVVEEQKYKKPSNPAGIPVWYHDGMICTGETYKAHIRLTFSKGTSLPDPKKLLAHRAMIIHENDKINKVAFKAFIKAAVKLNQKK